MTTDTRSLYSQLPATDRLLRDAAFASLLENHGHSQVVEQLRQLQDEARLAIRDTGALPGWSDDWAGEVARRFTRDTQRAIARSLT
jgi:L-seryl-tRNA(Sec) selenium transferase (EC 2.9.1.1)